MTATYDEALAPAGVNVAQFGLLRMLNRAGPTALTELGRLTELDRSTIGRNVKVLERMGLVAPRRGSDQRELLVALTKGGRRALTIGEPLWDQAQKNVEARLGMGVAGKFRELLHSL
ncbi:DNA-binding MarR family transcriptional regulator [Nitrobacteraceae bacterium AZCC 2146]